MVPGGVGIRFGCRSSFKELFVTKRMALSSFLVFLITCTCAVQLSPSAILWYNDAFVVLVVIGLSLYYFFLPFM